MARIEIHGCPVGYSTATTALERETWIGHRVARSYGAPRYRAIHGREQVVWAVRTMCGKKIDVVLEADWGFAGARPCRSCAVLPQEKVDKKKRRPDAVLVEIMPPMRWSALSKSNRRERGISAQDAF